MADGEGSSSSEDGFEPMEVNIPPDLARELGQNPRTMEGEGEDGMEADKVEQERREESSAAEREDETEEESLNLNKVATDYAQYLAVNSRQDVSESCLFGYTVLYLFANTWFPVFPPV